MSKCFVIILLLSFFSKALWGFDSYDNVIFERYGTQEGLGNLVVYDIIQDNNGYIWLGTGNGVSRFDGYEFRNYINDKENDRTIGSGPAPDLFLDSEGRLWIAVFSSGLYLYHEDTDDFTRYIHNPGNEKTISSNIPVSIAEDKNGYMWISTVDKGLNRLDTETGEFQRFINDPDDSNSLLSNELSGVFVDSDNILWISTFAGEILNYDFQTGSFTQILDASKESMYMREGKNGDLWIPTAGNGIFRYHRESGEFSHYKHNEKEGNSLSMDLVLNLIEDRKGHIWATTWGGGLNRFDPSTDSFEVFMKNSTDFTSLSSNDTWGLFEDRTGVIWVGTYGAGLNRYDAKEERFKIIRNNPQDMNSLSNNSVKSIFEDSYGYLWIGTLGGGLNRYDEESEKFTIYRKSAENEKSIDSDLISMIVEDFKRDLWIATDSGLMQYNRATDDFSKFLDGKLVRSVLIDSKGYLWIGTHYNGVYRYGFDGDFENYPLTDQFLSVIFEDSSETLWVGGATTLYKYDQMNDRFVRSLKNQDNPDQYLDLLITDIEEDDEKNLWIASTTKLLKFNRSEENYSIYTTEDGLLDDAFAGLIFDNNGDLWISSSKGVSKIDKSSHEIKNYDIGAFNRNSSFINEKGQIFFGGLDGLISFRPEDIVENSIPPEVVITTFKVFNKEIEGISTIRDSDKIELDYSDNFFSFEFAALDYSNPNKNQYKYKLEGFDESWIEVSGKRRYASYTNLDGGDYQFKVIASNNDGVWNTRETKVDIYIKPEFSDTLYFKIILSAIIILALAAIIFYIYKLRLSLIKQRLSESQILKLKMYLNEILDSMPSVIIGVNKNEKVALWNRTAEKTTDIRAEDAIGMPFSQVKSQLGIQISKDDIKNCLTSGKIVQISDSKMDEGEEEFVDITMYPLTTKDFADIIIRVDDVTRRHKLTERVTQSSKMDAMGQLAGGMAHDFNNILSGIINLTYLLKNTKTDINEKGSNYVDMIYNASINASELTSKLLTFSSKSDHELANVDIHNTIDETIEMLERTLDKNIQIIVDKRSRYNTVIGNKSDIQNIFINLCINSSHAMPHGGEIKIITTDVELSNKFCEVSEFDIEPGLFCNIEIVDSGTGIPLGKINRIFEPFYTTKEKGKGTGLGLYLVYGAVKQQKGAIKVYSEMGVGTSFHIKLPLSDNVEAISKENNVVKGSGTILLVDDEEIIRITCSDLLSQLGYNVLSAVDGFNAIDIFKKNVDKIDLVLMDMIMPKMSGKEAYYKLREINSRCKVIIASGFTKEKDIEELNAAGLCGFIHKPYQTEELSTLLSKILRER